MAPRHRGDPAGKGSGSSARVRLAALGLWEDFGGRWEFALMGAQPAGEDTPANPRRCRPGFRAAAHSGQIRWAAEEGFHFPGFLMSCETCHDMTCHDDLDIRYVRWEVGGTRARRADDRGSWDSDGGSWGGAIIWVLRTPRSRSIRIAGTSSMWAAGKRKGIFHMRRRWRWRCHVCTMM